MGLLCYFNREKVVLVKNLQYMFIVFSFEKTILFARMRVLLPKKSYSAEEAAEILLRNIVCFRKWW